VELKINWELRQRGAETTTGSSKALTTISSLVTIATPVVTVTAIFLTGKNSLPAAILAVYVCLLTTVVLLLLLGQERRHGSALCEQERRHAETIQVQEVRHTTQVEELSAEARRAARYQSAIIHIRNSFNSLANASWTVVEGDGSEEIFIRYVEDSIRFLAQAFSVITENACRVSVKITESVEGHATIHDIRVLTLCRSGDEPPEPASDDRIGNNTDFRAIFEEDLTYYLCNDLVAELARGYQNSHWTRQAIQSGNIKYKATIVWPIAAPRPLGHNVPPREVIGFLCVDTKTTDAFNDTFDVPIGSAFAGVLHLAIHRYRARHVPAP